MSVSTGLLRCVPIAVNDRQQLNIRRTETLQNMQVAVFLWPHPPDTDLQITQVDEINICVYHDMGDAFIGARSPVMNRISAPTTVFSNIAAILHIFPHNRNALHKDMRRSP